MNLIKNSAILAFFYKVLSRDGVLTRNFSSSLFFKAVDGILLWFPRLLRKIYAACPNVWEGSLFIRFIRAIGLRTEIPLSLFAFLLIVIPPELYGNSYVFCIVAFILVSAMLARAFDPEYKPLTSGLTAGGFSFWLTAYAFVTILYIPLTLFTGLSQGLRIVPRYLSCLFLLYVCVTSKQNYKSVRKIIGCSLAGMFIASCYAFFQFFFGLAAVNVYILDLSANSVISDRVFSFFENPNLFAFALIVLLPLTAPYIFRGGGRFSRAAAVIAAIAGVGALVLTYSRGAWLAFAAEIFVFTLIAKPKLIPYLLALALILTPFLPESILSRLLTIFTGDTSTNSRFEIYRASFELFLSQPFGVGLGLETARNYIYEFGLYGYYTHAHNILLQTLNEIGIIGVIAFFGTLFAAVKTGLNAKNKPPRENKMLAATVITVITGVLVCGLFDHALSYERVRLLFWLVTGTLVKAVCSGGKPDPSPGNAAATI